MTQSNRLKHLVIRVAKPEASFIYFQFEANDGLCFYSTLGPSIKQPYRDIDIKTHESLSDELMRLISALQSEFHLEILSDQWIDDNH
ncbi:MAG: hypothetical protein HN576_09500 [Bacteriovoracaceae bacterium]|jgi:hypothetical protein|nr:hypothetical protein [Bacteriovoracaceae bacterium]